MLSPPIDWPLASLERGFLSDLVISCKKRIDGFATRREFPVHRAVLGGIRDLKFKFFMTFSCKILTSLPISHSFYPKDFAMTIDMAF